MEDAHPPPPTRTSPGGGRQLAGHHPGQSLTLGGCLRTPEQGQEHVCLDCGVCSMKEKDREGSSRLWPPVCSPF